ncbi:uncharacterized protein LOC113782107 [Coffea eugenioides]|uniref:uncharacterized protein LOC113782107 n=1 Tax=Coffea eugenioides TaxID=49369 RepID=UPI000F611356|nr:uncharacterized protein LOC113782107 [Coffea eugenioides]
MAGGDRTSLVPTPPIHQRLNLGAEEEAKSCEFLVEMFLEEKVDNWFQGIKLEKPKLTWRKFEELLCQRFKGTCRRDIVEEFNKLHFTSGLKEEMKPMVKMLKPNTLSGVIKVAHLQEQALKLQGKTVKEGNKVVAEPRRNTILLEGQLARETVKILVDTGSSDSYIHHKLVSTQGIPYKYVKPFTVTIGDRSLVTSGALCPKVLWNVQNYKFCFDLRIMEFGDWDLILWVDWMCNYSPITFDFHQLKFSMFHQGEIVALHGAVNDATMELVRRKDLRGFLQAKRRCCAISAQAGKVTTEGQRVLEAITVVLDQFSKVFQEPTQLPPNKNLDHQIPLKPGVQALKMKSYRYPHSQKTEIVRQIADMLKSGIIKPSNSPYASPVLLVKKKDNTWHFCVDYRHLNDLIVKDRYPMPNIDELLDELYGAGFLSKIDLRSGYH